MITKFLIADDEPHIRESIIRKMNLIGLYDFIEAKDGEEAYQMIQNCLPDIVITDIRMPGMDGIELISKVKQQIKKDIIFIILSGYDLFEYAQKAVSLGAFAFLLKPVNFREMDLTLIKAVEQLSYLRDEKEKSFFLNLKARQGMDLSRRLFIHELLSVEDPDVADIKSRLHEPGIFFKYKDFATAIIQIDLFYTNGSDISTKDMELYEFSVENILTEILSSRNIDIFPFKYEDGQGFLFNFNSLDNISLNILRDLCVEVKSSIDRYFNFTITVGIGKIVNNILELNISYKSAISALLQRMLKGDGGIYIHSDTNNIEKSNRIINFKTEQCLLEAIERRDKTAIINLVHGLYTELTEGGFIDMEQLSNMNYQLILLFYKILNYLNIDLACELEDEFTQYKQVNMRHGINEVIGFFDKLIEDIFMIMEANKKSATSKLMEIIRNYILSNYDKDITLDVLSEIVHLTPTYVSKLFKQEFNENLIDFIISVRINKAKEFLRKGIYKSSEVCEKAGFNDVKYFYKMFKKYTGLKPSEYKNNLENELTI